MRNWCCYIILLFLSLGCQKQQNGFVLKGNIKGYTGNLIYVREMVPGNKNFMDDTIEVKNGVFVYKGMIECPRMVYLVPQDYKCRYQLFLDNSDIYMEVENEKPYTMKVSGSKFHDEYLTILNKADKILKQKEMYQYRFDLAKQFNKQYVDSTKIWAAHLMNILLTYSCYPTSEVLPYFASQWIDMEDLNSLAKYLEGLSGELDANVYVVACKRALQQGRNVVPGSIAYDFVLQDTTGKTYRLSDYRGCYVLIEFSASWCGWCKLEIPYLKEVHELTKTKNLVMFTINLDKERDLWVNDVLQENLPWAVISNLEAFDGELTRMYNVSGIPSIFLIDPEGRIVKKDLRGESMIAFINETIN